ESSMARNLVCSECGGEMKKGFVVETAGQIGYPNDASYWLEGWIEKDWLGNLKTDNKEKFYIAAYRCIRCGFLKFYAGPDHSGEKQE
ncbi:MAG: hypothetical protein AB1750_12855, partial [Chloroflexota bacterium]